MRLKYSAEILKIIEAGIEGDVQKVKECSQHLANMMPVGDQMRKAIQKRIDEEKH
jgi:hypothetical protein